MKVLLTGACGLVGSAIRRCGSEHEFVCLDINPAVEALGGVCADILDRDTILRSAEGCDAIIHTAAMHGGWRHKATPQQFLQTNVIGAENIFEAAIRHGIRRVVCSSTLEILCGSDWLAWGRSILTETLPPRPDWIYPITKLLVEQLGQAYVRLHGLEVVQLRYAAISGAPLAQLGTRLLARTISDADAARANLLALVQPGLRDETLLIAPQTPLTQEDVDAAAEEGPLTVLERHWPGCAAVLARQEVVVPEHHFWPVCCGRRAATALGWRPQDSFERYLHALGWHAAQSHRVAQVNHTPHQPRIAAGSAGG